jgi:hypothetical protein
MSPDLAADLRTLHEAGLVGRTHSDIGETEPHPYEVALDVMSNGGPIAERGVLRGDPRYLGCAMALLREASGDPTLCTRYDRRTSSWCTEPDIGDLYEIDTEGEALVAAIHALAEDCRHAAR